MNQASDEPVGAQVSRICHEIGMWKGANLVTPAPIATHFFPFLFSLLHLLKAPNLVAPLYQDYSSS